MAGVNKVGKRPIADREKAVNLVKHGKLTQEQAGVLVGVTKQAVSRWCRIAGVDCRAIQQTTQDKRREKAVAMRQNHASKAEIGRALKLSSRTVWKWLKDVRIPEGSEKTDSTGE